MKVMPADFDKWLENNEEELYIAAAESGADRELDYCPEAYSEKKYEEYLRNFD